MPIDTGSAFHKDDGKSRVDLIPAEVLLEVGKVYTHGLTKYGERNWENYADDWSWGQLLGSSLRHIFKWMCREDYDESGEHHLAHAIWNLISLRALIIHGRGKDDRSTLFLMREAATPPDVEKP